MTITPATDRALLAVVLELHSAFGIYSECGHKHTDKDDGVLDVDDVGLTCQAGLEYYVCAACCMDDNYQTETCVVHHDHDREARHLCATRDILDRSIPS